MLLLIGKGTRNYNKKQMNLNKEKTKIKSLPHLNAAKFCGLISWVINYLVRVLPTLLVFFSLSADPTPLRARFCTTHTCVSRAAHGGVNGGQGAWYIHTRGSLVANDGASQSCQE